jgi:hypothetical protein
VVLGIRLADGTIVDLKSGKVDRSRSVPPHDRRPTEASK